MAGSHLPWPFGLPGRSSAAGHTNALRPVTRMRCMVGPAGKPQRRRSGVVRHDGVSTPATVPSPRRSGGCRGAAASRWPLVFDEDDTGSAATLEAARPRVVHPHWRIGPRLVSPWWRSMATSWPRRSACWSSAFPTRSAVEVERCGLRTSSPCRRTAAGALDPSGRDEGPEDGAGSPAAPTHREDAVTRQGGRRPDCRPPRPPTWVATSGRRARCPERTAPSPDDEHPGRAISESKRPGLLPGAVRHRRGVAP